MRLKRVCKECTKDFVAIKHTQLFCSRRCFKKDYYKRTKEKNALLFKTHPQYQCPVCTGSSDVGYDPVKHFEVWESYICPFCGIPRQIMLQHENDPRFHKGHPSTEQYVIQSAIVSGPGIFSGKVTITEIIFAATFA